MPTIPKSAFLEPYIQTIGLERANSLFKEVIREIELTDSESYDLGQAKLILEQLKSKGSIIKITATTITTRLILDGLFTE